LGGSVPAINTELMKSFHDVDVASLSRFGQPLRGMSWLSLYGAIEALPRQAPHAVGNKHEHSV
jgi:hypothetical protein